MDSVIFTFETTHHALWAEEIAREHWMAHEVIPAPPEAHARCDIALQTLRESAAALADLLREHGVAYALYEPARSGP